MEKAIFSITCTTCQARLVVRSEAAIGAILECPKCESMVHVVPPPGWMPAPIQSDQSLLPAAGGPPPLDRVHNGFLTLELEPINTSLLGLLSRHVWLAGGTTLTAVLAIACGLWLALAPRPATGPVASETRGGTAKVDPPVKKTELAATKIERPAVEAERPATEAKLSATAVAGLGANPPPTPPGPQSGGVPTGAARDSGVPKTVAPTPSLATLSPRAPTPKRRGPTCSPGFPKRRPATRRKTLARPRSRSCRRHRWTLPPGWPTPCAGSS